MITNELTHGSPIKNKHLTTPDPMLIRTWTRCCEWTSHVSVKTRTSFFSLSFLEVLQLCSITFRLSYYPNLPPCWRTWAVVIHSPLVRKGYIISGVQVIIEPTWLVKMLLVMT